MSGPDKTDTDVLIIGSGIGGLGIAAILAKRGHRTRVLERHRVAGGLTHTFQRRGFQWDVGLHYVGRVHRPDDPLSRVFDYVTDGALAWERTGSVLDEVIFPDARYAFAAGRPSLQDALSSRFPQQTRAIAAYLDRVESIQKAGERYLACRALPAPLASLLSPVLGWSFRREARLRTGEVLAAATNDLRLASVLAGRWGNYGAPPGESSFAMHALAEAFFLDGASYPKGGASQIARTITAAIARAGGRVEVGREVEQIVVRRGRAVGVRLADGEEITARTVISNVGVHNTLALLPEEHRPRSLLDRIERLPMTEGHVALYLGLRGGSDQLALPRAHLWVHPRDDLDGNVRRYRADPSAPFPFVHISSPSAKDPLRRRSDRSALVALAPASYDTFAPWRREPWRRRGAEYEDLKAQITQRMLSVVLRELPQIAGCIVHCELSTPLSTEHFTRHVRGSTFGLAHTPARFAEAALRPATPIPGLLWVGQDLATVGVGSSLMSGVLAACVVERANVLAHIEQETSARRFSSLQALPSSPSTAAPRSDR